MNPRSNNHRAETIWFFALATIVSLVIISWSFERGRLQSEMDYEDIITHLDGLQRWRDLSEGGVSQLVADYLQSPPHAPLHSFMAAASFMLFGVRDWAPYALNTFLLFAFLLLVRRETKPFGIWPSSLTVLGALFVPVSFQSVHQFRPDFPCALATLWGMVVYPRWREKNFTKKAAVSGMCFGLALLAKPPFFPYTLVMGALPWLLAVLAGIKERKSATGAWHPILQSWPFFAATALVAGPHYAVAWKKILEYIEFNQFGESAHVWKMTGGLDFQLAYHIFGYSGTFMLGHAVWILLSLLGLGLLLSIMRWKLDFERSRHFLRLFCFSLWAWVFIAWNPHMNPFFGVAFQYGVVLASMVSAAWMLQIAQNAHFLLRATAIIPTCAVAGVIWLAFPFKEHDQNAQRFTLERPEIREFAKNLPSEVYRKLTKWRHFSDSGYTLLSTYGIVSSHRLQWFANKERANFQFYGVPFWPIEQVLDLFDQETKKHDRIDFAVVSEPGAEGVFEELPNAKTTGSLIKWLNGRKDYRVVDSISTPSGKKYLLYMAAPNFGIFESTCGLGPTRGPVIVPGKPMVRPAVAAEISLDFVSPDSGEGLLEFSFRSEAPIATVRVAVNSCEVAEIDTGRLDSNCPFWEMDYKVALVKGSNQISIRLYDSAGNMVQNPSMIVRRLRISPPGDSSPFDDVLRKINNQK